MFKTPGTFCGGCEFAGNIPAEVKWDHTQETADRSVNFRIFLDAEMRISGGFASAAHPEVAPSVEDIARRLVSARVCLGTCRLIDAGYVPIELSQDEKRDVLFSQLNSLEGVKEVGWAAVHVEIAKDSEES